MQSMGRQNIPSDKHENIFIKFIRNLSKSYQQFIKNTPEFIKFIKKYQKFIKIILEFINNLSKCVTRLSRECHEWSRIVTSFIAPQDLSIAKLKAGEVYKIITRQDVKFDSYQSPDLSSSLQCISQNKLLSVQGYDLAQKGAHPVFRKSHEVMYCSIYYMALYTPFFKMELTIYVFFEDSCHIVLHF